MDASAWISLGSAVVAVLSLIATIVFAVLAASPAILAISKPEIPQQVSDHDSRTCHDKQLAFDSPSVRGKLTGAATQP